MATRPQVSKSSPYVPRYVKASSRIRSLCQALGHCGRAKKASKKRKKYASSNKRREQKTDTYSSRRFSRFFFSIRRPDYLLVSWRLEAWNRLLYSVFNAQYPDGTSIRTLETKTQFLRRPFQFSVNEVFRMEAEHFSFKMKVLAISKLAKQSQKTPFCSGE